MPFVRGFRALRYNKEKINDFSNVITPPYDIITPEIREDLAKRNEYNFVHIDLPVDNSGKSRYENAKNLFKEWQEKDILIRDTCPSAYWLRQRFTDIRGIQMERLTLLALTKLPEVDEKSYIFPHERTFNKPVEDRMALISATNAQLSPVFFIFPDKEKVLMECFVNEIRSKERFPDISVVTIDGVINDFWRTDWNDAITNLFIEKPLYIADGHHRFQTAKKILEEKRKNFNSATSNILEPYQYVLTGFVTFEDPGLVIYAPHRVIKKLPDIDINIFFQKLGKYFKVIQVEKNPVDCILQKQNECEKNSSLNPTHCFGLVVKNKGRFVIELTQEGYERLNQIEKTSALYDVNVYILHKLIFEEILQLEPNVQLIYETNPFRCIEMVELEGAEMAFLINSISPETIKKCADNGEYMPQKATYFFPKIPSGLVIYELSQESL